MNRFTRMNQIFHHQVENLGQNDFLHGIKLLMVGYIGDTEITQIKFNCQ